MTSQTADPINESLGIDTTPASVNEAAQTAEPNKIIAVVDGFLVSMKDVKVLDVCQLYTCWNKPLM